MLILIFTIKLSIYNKCIVQYNFGLGREGLPEEAGATGPEVECNCPAFFIVIQAKVAVA